MTTSTQEQPSNTVAFHTLGCRANQLETSAIADEFRQHHWRIVPFDESAALYVINTCTVTESADKEARKIIRRAKRNNPNGRVAVTGCYAQIASHEIAGIEGVSYVIGNNFKQDIFNIIQETPVNGLEPFVMVSELDKSRVMAGATSSAINRTRASLKIQDGCDFKCTYCIIWVARGPSRSLPIDSLKDQLRDLLAQGFQEIVLTGINIGQYVDPATERDLAGLLEELVSIEGQFRLRLSSLDPAEVTPELVALMARSDKLCPYVHLSMQSAENETLKRMGRRHKVPDLYRVCQSLVDAVPDIAIGSDIIAGFPEETDERFEKTVAVLTELPLSYFHVFTYSKRTGTPAADFEDQVPEPVKKQRTQRLIELSHEKNMAYRQRFVGKVLPVIVEENGHRGVSDNYIRVELNRDDLSQNQLIPVTIKEVSDEATFGEVC